MNYKLIYQFVKPSFAKCSKESIRQTFLLYAKLKEGDMEKFNLSLLCKYLAWIV